MIAEVAKEAIGFLDYLFYEVLSESELKALNRIMRKIRNASYSLQGKDSRELMEDDKRLSDLVSQQIDIVY